MDKTATLLKTLTEAHGVPGHEGEIRDIVRKELADVCEFSLDNIGSVICRLKGDQNSPTVMLAGHMDEIGFMVRFITKEGFLRFVPLGGWFDQVLLGQRVIVQTHKGNVVGVIGAKPPHMLTPKEREKVVEKKSMYIDIGARSRDEVEQAGVRVGDPVVPHAGFVILANPDTYMAKAFDDRVGVALMIEALKALSLEKHPNQVVGAATVMEEVGLRGGETSTEIVNPDVAIVLESDIPGDVPGIKDEQTEVAIGKGPSVLFYDARMLPNLKLRDLVLETAKDLEIPVQVSIMEGGATDGGAIHLHKTGVPTVVIGVPARHIHSDSAIMHRADYDRALKLVVEVVTRLSADAVSDLTN